ncbi:hypothetical protein K3495_g16994, partial [Podosphaera aphanis]
MLLSLSEKRLWAEAVKTFIYTKNRQFHKTVTGMTPYEALHGEIPSTDHLQPFGRECFVHIPKAKRLAGTKFLPRAQKGLFVGYTEALNHYRIFIPENGKVIVSADVNFPPYTMTQKLPVSKLPENLIPKNTSIIWKNHPTTTQQNLVTQNESSGNTGSEGVIETHDNTDSSSDLPVQNSIQSGAPPIQSTRSRRHIRPRVFNDTITGE